MTVSNKISVFITNKMFSNFSLNQPDFSFRTILNPGQSRCMYFFQKISPSNTTDMEKIWISEFSPIFVGPMHCFLLLFSFFFIFLSNYNTQYQSDGKMVGVVPPHPIWRCPDIISTHYTLYLSFTWGSFYGESILTKITYKKI